MARITKEVTGVNIEFAENGFVIEYSGRDESETWQSTKQICLNFVDLTEKLENIIEHCSEYKHG